MSKIGSKAALAACLLIPAAACGTEQSSSIAVRPGSLVRIHYTIFADGTLYDSTVDREPIEVLIGSGDLLAAVEERIVGLKVGDDRTFELSSDAAYGPRMPDAVQKIPKLRFGPAGRDLRPGMKVQGMIGAEPAEARVVAVEGDAVRLDFNHPLAGKDLRIKVLVMEIVGES